MSTQEAAYERALHRAQAARLEITGQGRTRQGLRFFTVPSATEPERSHIVVVQGASLRCDCMGGQHDRLCQHRALVHAFLVKESEQRQALGRERAQMERDERDEERRRSSDGGNGHGGQAVGSAPRVWSDNRPVSM